MNETNKGTTMGEQFNQHFEKRGCLLWRRGTICLVDGHCLLNRTFPVQSPSAFCTSAEECGGGGAHRFIKGIKNPQTRFSSKYFRRKGRQEILILPHLSNEVVYCKPLILCVRIVRLLGEDDRQGFQAIGRARG